MNDHNIDEMNRLAVDDEKHCRRTDWMPNWLYYYWPILLLVTMALGVNSFWRLTENYDIPYQTCIDRSNKYAEWLESGGALNSVLSEQELRDAAATIKRVAPTVCYAALSDRLDG